MSRQTVRALARSKEVFYASVAGELFSGLFMGPIRGQMTRCILPTEIGKVAPVPAVPACQPSVQVFAMLASLECAVPILGSMIFTSIYNATSGLAYPWQGTFYFAGSGCLLPGRYIDNLYQRVSCRYNYSYVQACS